MVSVFSGISKNSLTSATFSYGTSKSRAETVPAKEDSERVHPPEEALHLTSCGRSLHMRMPEVTLSPVPPGVSLGLHCPFFHRVLADPGFFLDSRVRGIWAPLMHLPGFLAAVCPEAQRLDRPGVPCHCRLPGLLSGRRDHRCG